MEDKISVSMLCKKINAFITSKAPTPLSELSSVSVGAWTSEGDYDYPVLHFVVKHEKSSSGFSLLVTSNARTAPKYTSSKFRPKNKSVLALSEPYCSKNRRSFGFDSVISTVPLLTLDDDDEFEYLVVEEDQKENVRKIMEIADCSEIVALLALRDYSDLEQTVIAISSESNLIETYEEEEQKYLDELARREEIEKQPMVVRSPITYKLACVYNGADTWCGNTVSIRPIIFNDYGCCLPDVKPFVKFVPARKSNAEYYYCWTANAPIKMADGTYKRISDVVVGDELSTLNGNTTTVKFLKLTPIYRDYRMVDMGEYYVTPGHPVFWNGDWYRPDEVLPVTVVSVETIYNLYCEPYHEVILGQQVETVFSSLGGYCPRLAERDPYTDHIYGRGWGTPLARRYEWLLALHARVPDCLVEKLTEIYWSQPARCLAY